MKTRWMFRRIRRSEEPKNPILKESHYTGRQLKKIMEKRQEVVAHERTSSAGNVRDNMEEYFLGSIMEIL